MGGRNTRWKALEGAWVMGTCGSEFWCCTECNTNKGHPNISIHPERDLASVRVFPEFPPFGWFFHSFPFWFPLLFFYPFLSPLLLTNQAPIISIKGGTGTVFVLSLISEDIHCTKQVFVFILGYYKLRISAVPAGHYLLLVLLLF